MVDGIPVRPMNAAEHRRLDRRIKKKHRKLRRRYPEVHGKKVDWISHWYEEGYLSFNVRFTDGKNFSILCSPTIVTNIVDLSDMKTGNNEIIREYYKRRED
jgi:NurA-like 5'-3' nuclease